MPYENPEDQYCAENPPYDWTAAEKRWSEEKTAAIDAVLGQQVVALTETEGAIVLTLSGNKVIRWYAGSECCDSSWFVLSDIDTPAEFIGSTVIGYHSIAAERGSDSDCTYGFNLYTSAGIYHVRMANDGGESGYYSGILDAKLFLDASKPHNYEDRWVATGIELGVLDLPDFEAIPTIVRER